MFGFLFADSERPISFSWKYQSVITYLIRTRVDRNKVIRDLRD